MKIFHLPFYDEFYYSLRCFTFSNLTQQNPKSIKQNYFSLIDLQSKTTEREPVVALKSEQSNYNTLQRSVDELMNSNGLKYFENSVKMLTDNIIRIVEMKKEVSESQKRKYEEIRTAIDIRVFVSKNILQNLTTPLGMVKAET